jgi:hypothetical protein
MNNPVLQFPPELLLAAQDVRVAFFDVDGVLTDGGSISARRVRRSSAFTPWTAMASSCCNRRALFPPW